MTNQQELIADLIAAKLNYTGPMEQLHAMLRLYASADAPSLAPVVEAAPPPIAQLVQEEKAEPSHIPVPEPESVPTIDADPCTFCAYNPPSSRDGKPCCYCPATSIRKDGE